MCSLEVEVEAGATIPGGRHEHHYPETKAPRLGEWYDRVGGRNCRPTVIAPSIAAKLG